MASQELLVDVIQAEVDIEEISQTIYELIYCLRQDARQKEALTWLAEFRKIPLELLENAGMFYVENLEYIANYTNIPDWLLEKIGMSVGRDNVFRDRFMIPIPDIEGKFIGLVGYRPESDDVNMKYLLSKTLYFSKVTSCYPAHCLPYCFEEDTIVIVEGFFCALNSFSVGVEYCVSNYGVSLYDSMVEVYNLFTNKIIIPDSKYCDTAGAKAIPKWNEMLTGKVATIIIKSVPLDGSSEWIKDLDEFLKQSEEHVSRYKSLIKTIREEMSSPLFRRKEYVLE